jgi:bacterioferritin
MTAPSRPFVSDVTERRRRAREHIERGAITRTYGGDAQQTIDLLQTALATEIACVLRDTMHNIASVGIDSESVKAEFAEHARDEYEHMEKLANRINQLGGTPNFDPEGLQTWSATEYGHAVKLIDMIKENRPPESCSKGSWPKKKTTPTTCTTCSSDTKGSRS